MQTGLTSFCSEELWLGDERCVPDGFTVSIVDFTKSVGESPFNVLTQTTCKQELLTKVFSD
ncbi:hypothetical protein ABMB67_004292 [Halalkalibacter oceani]